MSRLEELIQTLCPDGVEYSLLCNLIEDVRERNTKSKIKEVRSVTNFGRLVPTSEVFNRIVTSSDTSNYKVVREGMFAYNPARINIGSIAYSEESEPVIVSPMYVVFSVNNDRILPRYLDCYFRSNVGKYQITSKVEQGVRFRLPFDALATLSVPLPPILVQKEIVCILDTFTALDTELEAELAARTKQYEHYRNYLLINHRLFDDGTDLFEVPEHSLDEVCLPVSNIRWNENADKTFRYIDLTSTDRATKSIQNTVTITSENAPSRAQQIVRVNDVIFGSTRPTLKRYAFITDEFDGEICSTGFCVLRSDPKKVLPKYLYFHISSTAFENHVEKYQRGSAYPAITDKDLKSFKIPVPPLEVQEQIVSILDRFEALVNDLKSGLPAEIALRRKQYEYYRNKLLTFKPIQPPL